MMRLLFDPMILAVSAATLKLYNVSITDHSPLTMDLLPDGSVQRGGRSIVSLDRGGIGLRVVQLYGICGVCYGKFDLGSGIFCGGWCGWDCHGEYYGNLGGGRGFGNGFAQGAVLVERRIRKGEPYGFYLYRGHRIIGVSDGLGFDVCA